MLYLSGLLGLATAIGVTVANQWIKNWYDLWIPIALTIAISLGYLLIYVAIIYTATLFMKLGEPREKPSKLAYFVMTQTMPIIMFFGRVRIHLSGKEKMPKDSRFLFVGNHISDFDPMVVMHKLRRYPISFVSKPENFQIPLAGKYIDRLCFLPINRDDVKKAFKTINQAADYLKRDVVSIGIYPEGKRNKEGKGLLPFRNGAFKIATKAKVPIVVCVTQNTEKIVENFPWHHTDVFIKIVGVISAEEVTQSHTEELSEKVRQMMLEAL